MKIVRLLMLIALVFASVAVFQSCTKSAGDKVVVKGSTTVLPIAQKASEAFYRSNRISISISGTGSGDGIKSLIDGSCDIANSSREMSAKEKEMAAQKGEEIKEIAIAYDMIVPIVHPSNPVKNLTLEQLKAIYDGSIKNWKQLGGKDEEIVVISRDSSSGTYEVWESKVMKKTEVRKDALLQASNGTIVSTVSQNPKAIGYVGYGYLNESVKTVFVNNVEPTIANGKSGIYPISRKLYMYVNEKKIKPAAKSYIDFVLSRDGQELVKAAGFIPVINL